MLIDFEKIEATVIPAFYGGKKEAVAQMQFDGVNRIMRGVLHPGASIGTHPHADSSEVVYVISGTGEAVCDGQTEALRPGVCHYCPRGSTHSMENTGDTDLLIFTVVPKQ